MLLGTTKPARVSSTSVSTHMVPIQVFSKVILQLAMVPMKFFMWGSNPVACVNIDNFDHLAFKPGSTTN